MGEEMKQIRLKDGVEKIENCHHCPCFDDERYCCNINPADIDWDNIDEFCPLKDYKGEEE